MKREEPLLIGDLIKLFISKNSLEEGINISRIYSSWELVVGEEYNRYTLTRSFRDGKLYCRISSPVIKSRLFMERRKIRDKINNLLPSPMVKEIIIL